MSNTTPTIPHSWCIESWPDSVWPHKSGRGRWLVRAHRNDLTQAGCLARVGRELVILGKPYERWLQRQATNVATYQFPGANPQDAA